MTAFVGLTAHATAATHSEVRNAFLVGNEYLDVRLRMKATCLEGLLHGNVLSATTVSDVSSEFDIDRVSDRPLNRDDRDRRSYENSEHCSGSPVDRTHHHIDVASTQNLLCQSAQVDVGERGESTVQDLRSPDLRRVSPFASRVATVNTHPPATWCGPASTISVCNKLVRSDRDTGYF